MVETESVQSFDLCNNSDSEFEHKVKISKGNHLLNL